MQLLSFFFLSGNERPARYFHIIFINLEIRHAVGFYYLRVAELCRFAQPTVKFKQGFTRPNAGRSDTLEME